MIELHTIKLAYDNRLILNIPELRFEVGKIYAIVGPNGSGKSTLLKLLGQLIAPLSGELYFQGQNIYQGGQAQRAYSEKLGIILQAPYLFSRSVFENVALPLKLQNKYSRVQIRQKVQEILENLQLSHLQERKKHQLSGGEVQRIALARALITKPEIILLDEPLANIDEYSKKMLENSLKRLNQTEGKLIIFSAHDNLLANRLAHQVISIVGGGVVHAGIENLFKGKLIENQEHSLFDTGRLKIILPPQAKEIEGLIIHPEHIIVSRTPIESSAKNCFYGSIVRVMANGRKIDIVVDVGEEVQARITKESFQDLNLNIGEKVYLIFKAFSVVTF